MVRMLLAAASLAAFVLPASPVGAQHPIRVEGPAGHASHARFDHHGRRGGNDGAAIWSGYDLQSSYDDSGWSGESGNDWWNSRPDRAYPRWVQDQRAKGSCDADRMWWSGSGWHC